MGIHLSFDSPDATTARAEMLVFLGYPDPLAAPTVGNARTSQDDRQAKMFPKTGDQQSANTYNGAVIPGGTNTDMTAAETLVAEQREIKAPVADKPKRGRPVKVTDVVEVAPPAVDIYATTAANISTGEERSDQRTTEEDKAPEAPVKIEKKLLTLDDVRGAAKPYIDKFGMPAASSDLTPCLVAATGCKAISELADKGQTFLQSAIDAFTAAGNASIRYGAVA